MTPPNNPLSVVSGMGSTRVEEKEVAKAAKPSIDPGASQPSPAEKPTAKFIKNMPPWDKVDLGEGVVVDFVRALRQDGSRAGSGVFTTSDRKLIKRLTKLIEDGTLRYVVKR